MIDKPARRAQLRFALVGMATRYGEACLNQGGAYSGSADTWEKWTRARDRRFKAMMRLAAALGRLDR